MSRYVYIPSQDYFMSEAFSSVLSVHVKYCGVKVIAGDKIRIAYMYKYKRFSSDGDLISEILYLPQ